MVFCHFITWPPCGTGKGWLPLEAVSFASFPRFSLFWTHPSYPSPLALYYHPFSSTYQDQILTLSLLHFGLSWLGNLNAHVWDVYGSSVFKTSCLGEISAYIHAGEIAGIERTVLLKTGGAEGLLFNRNGKCRICWGANTFEEGRS